MTELLANVLIKALIQSPTLIEKSCVRCAAPTIYRAAMPVKNFKTGKTKWIHKAICESCHESFREVSRG